MIRDQFTDGECPDCGEIIPEDMADGGECANCGHVFYEAVKSQVIELDGLSVELYRADDGTLVVGIDGPGDDDLTDEESPDIRVWMNEALIYAHGEVGDDLSERGTVSVAELRRTGEGV